MAEKNESDEPSSGLIDAGSGVYIDSSGLAKLYVPEPESEPLDRFLRGRSDLMISDLCITEVISAVARRRREGALDAEQAMRIRDAVLSDARSGSFRLLDLNPAIHREAERMLLSTDSIALRIWMLYTLASPFRARPVTSSHSTTAWRRRQLCKG